MVLTIAPFVDAARFLSRFHEGFWRRGQACSETRVESHEPRRATEWPPDTAEGPALLACFAA